LQADESLLVSLGAEAVRGRSHDFLKEKPLQISDDFLQTRPVARQIDRHVLGLPAHHLISGLVDDLQSVLP
jgi:hypothetical protein